MRVKRILFLGEGDLRMREIEGMEWERSSLRETKRR